MCTGKTHLLCSAAVVATPLTLSGVQLPGLNGAVDQAWLGAGLLVIGVTGGLFPDLDAPESELRHAPYKLARSAGWATVSALGLRKSSLPDIIVRSIFWLPGTLLGSILAGLSRAIRSITHHRGLTHELRGMAIFTGLVILLTFLAATFWRLPAPHGLNITILVGGAWALGYLTHLMLDAATIAGIPLLSSRRLFHLLPHGWRIRTGTWPDVILLRGLAIAWIALLLALSITS